MTASEKKTIVIIRIIATLTTLFVGIGIGYLIWHDNSVKAIKTTDTIKVDSLQNVINILTKKLNNIKEYKVKEKIVYRTQILHEKEKLYKDLDTSARVNVFQKWIVDSTNTETKPYKNSDTSIAITLPQMDYLTLQQYRYQKTNAILDDYKIGYYNKDSITTIQKNIIETYAQVNQSKDNIINSQLTENKNLENQIRLINKELKKERNKTIITGVAGGLIAGAITILYITK